MYSLCKILKFSPDTEVERVGIRQTVWPQGTAGRAATAAPGPCVESSNTQVWSGLKTTDNRACGPLSYCRNLTVVLPRLRWMEPGICEFQLRLPFARFSSLS